MTRVIKQKLTASEVNSASPLNRSPAFFEKKKGFGKNGKDLGMEIYGMVSYKPSGLIHDFSHHSQAVYDFSFILMSPFSQENASDIYFCSITSCSAVVALTIRL